MRPQRSPRPRDSTIESRRKRGTLAVSLNSKAWRRGTGYQLLDTTPLTRLTELDVDPLFQSRARDLLTRFAAEMAARSSWAESLAPKLVSEHPVAYFSAEFAIHESLPIYAGGLGVLAADHLKSASDLGTREPPLEITAANALSATTESPLA